MYNKSGTSFETYAKLYQGDSKLSSNITINDNIITQKDTKGSFNKVFTTDSNINDFYDNAIKHNVERVLQGNNVQLYCYGAGNSGKQYTMLNNDIENNNIMSKIGTQVFNTIADNQKTKYLVLLSVYQLHSTFNKSKSYEFITDLICPDTSKSLNIIEYTDQVEDISRIVITSSDQLNTYLRQAYAVYKSLAQRSNREQGHLVIDLRIESSNKDDVNRIIYGTLRTVLFVSAGGKALEYNNGLKEFNNIVNQRSNNIPDFEINYNNSRLTTLLTSSLSSIKSNAYGVFLLFINITNDNIIDMLLLNNKLRNITNTIRVNFNTISVIIKELRDEIKKRRDELKLDNPTTYIQDINPENVQTLQRLILELERVKSDTWHNKKQNSAEFIRKRVQLLKNEGLSSILNDNVIEIPKDLILDSKEKLNYVINLHNLVRSQEDKVDSIKHKYNTLLKKVKPDADSNDKMKQQVDKQLVLLNQEQDILNKHIFDYNNAINNYTTVQKKILLLESKHTKQYIFPEDSVYIQRSKDQELWNELKKEKEELLDGEFSASQKRSEELQKEISNCNDVDACKKLLSTLADSIQQKDMRIKELEIEKNLIIGTLYKKEANYEAQLQRFQEHMFFVFRNYRSHFEEQKIRMESRYRDLLENSVKDALKLQEENGRLRSELHKRVTL